MPKRKILIADDEPRLRELVCAVLSDDYEVIEAPNGEEAIKIAQNQKPDLIFMDIMMPVLDGVRACFRLKQTSETGSIPIVMLTARSQELHEAYSKRLGADGYVKKPFTNEHLLDVVHKFLG